MREKAAQNMRDYATMQQERRGQTLVNTKSQPFPFPEQMRYRR